MTKKVAVIGCGYWGKNLIRNFWELGDLAVICDIDGKALESFGEKYPDVRLIKDVKDVLRDPAIDAAVIATPAATHYSLVREVLSGGKDVFVEKPLALKLKDGKELVSLAEKKGKILMVGHILEYHPAVQKLKDMIRQGELGKIQYIYSNRLNLGKFRTEENILWSFAPHDISVVTSLLEEMPEEVSAHGGNYLNPRIADITITAMTFPSGVKAHIFVSWLHPYKEQKFVIIGNKIMAVFDDLHPHYKLLTYSHKIEWVGRLPVPKPEEALPVAIEKKEPLKAECEHFLECLSTRRNPKTDGANGLRVLKILEACQESLKREGKVVRLPKEKT